jgi:hypothetical protein
MYRLTAIVFLLATVFSHASADAIVQRSTPALPGVPAHGVPVGGGGGGLRRLLRRDDDSYCSPGYIQNCNNGHCCPRTTICCGTACCPLE